MREILVLLLGTARFEIRHGFVWYVTNYPSGQRLEMSIIGGKTMKRVNSEIRLALSIISVL